MTLTYRFKVDKLIRDNMPSILRASGVQVFERIMDKEEYIERLKDKLLEEANEVITASNQKAICEEAADLLEVILSIAHLYNLSLNDIIHAAEKKRLEKGGFKNRIYTDYVEMDASNPAKAYYEARPNHYPKIF